MDVKILVLEEDVAKLQKLFHHQNPSKLPSAVKLPLKKILKDGTCILDWNFLNKNSGESQ